MNVSTDGVGLYQLKFEYLAGAIDEDTPISYFGDLKAQSGQAIDTVTVSIN